MCKCLNEHVSIWLLPKEQPSPKISKEQTQASAQNKSIMLHIANMKQVFHIYLTLSSATHCKPQDMRPIDHFQVLDFESELFSQASPWCNEDVSKRKNLLRSKIIFFFLSFFLDVRPYSVVIIFYRLLTLFSFNINNTYLYIQNTIKPLYFPGLYIQRMSDVWF